MNSAFPASICQKPDRRKRYISGHRICGQVAVDGDTDTCHQPALHRTLQGSCPWESAPLDDASIRIQQEQHRTMVAATLRCNHIAPARSCNNFDPISEAAGARGTPRTSILFGSKWVIGSATVQTSRGRLSMRTASKSASPSNRLAGSATMREASVGLGAPVSIDWNITVSASSTSHSGSFSLGAGSVATSEMHRACSRLTTMPLKRGCR